jgi:acetyl-CoA carboxylase biotin carboxyl carrier protein
LTELPAEITGTVWKIIGRVGDSVAEDEVVLIMESMKMEIPVQATEEGIIREIRCEEGQAVQEGDVLMVLD